MKKIKQVCFNDFRAFNGEVKFDFFDKEGNIADFVCIYGQNGMGKSSFFDGIEWLFTGKIHRMEKDTKSGVKNFKGNILKNIYATSKYAVVKVTFDDEKSAIRILKPRSDAYNDYVTGKFEPKEYKNILGEKQILPHSKIDSFVYATKPVDKYEEWGEFWDPDGNERSLFNSIYILKKQCEKKIEYLEKEILENDNELNKLKIDDETMNYINHKIEVYNNMYPFIENKISKIEKIKGQTIILPKDKEISYQKSELISAQDRMMSLLDKLNFISNNNTKYQEIIVENLLIEKTKKRWEKIINDCKEKENLIKEKDTYVENRKVFEEDFKNITKLNSANKQWFEKYLWHSNIINKISETSKQIELERQQLSILKNKKDNLLSMNQSNLKKRDTLKINREEFINYGNEINYRFENIKYHEKVIRDLEAKILDINNVDKTYKSEIDELNNSILKMDELEKSLVVKWTNIKISSQTIIDLKNIFEEDFKYIDAEIQEQKVIISNRHKRYKKSQEALNDLESIIIKIKDYINTKGLSICPICKAKYDESSILLSRINLSIQQEFTQKLYDEWINACNSLKDILERKEDIIKKWNMVSEEEIKKIYIKLSINKDKKDALINQKEALENVLSINRKRTQDIKNKLSEFGFINQNIDISSIKKWLKNMEDKHKLDIIENNNKMQSITKEEKTIEERIINLEKFVSKSMKEDKAFITQESNKCLISIVKKYKLGKWEYVENKYDSLIKKIREILIQINNIDNNLKKLRYVNVEKKKLYINKLNSIGSLSASKDKLINTYAEFCRYVFRNVDITASTIDAKVKSVSSTINRIQCKINILNDILSQVSISDYNKRYTNLIEIKNRLTFNYDKYKKGSENLNKIFNLIKEQIELNVENVFSGKTMNKIYKKIEPHKTFRSLKYEISFNKKDQAELYIKGTNSSHTQDILPELFYSSAQLNTVALSIFLGGALSIDKPEINTIFIDDPIGHFDDINVLAFIDLLRTIISTSGWQIIISTHDESLFDLLQNKLSSEYYSSKFIKFSSVGCIER
ncbi:hypothetical protein FDF44_05275 [Clostridium botulinum]|nr:hypothetical protein [Clostridium botulinum]